MRRIYRFSIVGCLLAVWFSYFAPSIGAGFQPMKTTVFSEGSVPPAFRGSFACIQELNDKPFSDLLIQDCVAKLKANYFIRDVEVHTQEMDEGRWVSVEFHLSSESVIVDDFRIQTFDSQGPEIWKMLSKSDANLHVRGTYTWSAESAAYSAITFLYRAQGKLVGVIPEVKMDYKKGKAWVNFRVVEGPATLKHPLTPPYGTWCNDHATYISWLDTDDGVPVELIESNLALASAFTCFSDELAQRDKDYLSKMSILTTASVEYSGSIGTRRIEYRLRAKPLKVEKISLRGYGYAPLNLEDGDPSVLKNLRLKNGELFSRQAVRESTEYLRKTYSKDGYWAEVRVQEEPAGADGLRVTFSVLEYPLQTVIVDGHVLQSTKEHLNDAATAY